MATPDAVIVFAVRSPIGGARNALLATMRSDDLAARSAWSFELAIRPALRLARHLHLQRIAPATPSSVGTGQDL